MPVEPVPAGPVVIVGLGPVGATLAVLLGQAGVPVVVLERDRAPHALPRAAHLDDDALRILDAAGVADAIVAEGRPIDGFRLVDAQLRTLVHARKRAEVETGWPAALLVHQPTVERALRARLAGMPGVSVWTGHAVEHVDQDGLGVTVRGSAAGEAFSLCGAFVVGCDGARSRVREAVGARLVGGRFEQPWLVVDTLLHDGTAGAGQAPALPADLLQIADPRRPATYVPFPGRRRRWEFRLLAGETEAQMTRPESVRALLATHTDPDHLTVERAAVYTFHDLAARPWRRGRCLIAGDAAHQMPPFLGQGLGAGLHDAATLAWTLALVWHGAADAALLDAVEAERRPHVEAVTRLAVRLGRLVSAGGSAARLRDAALHAALRVGPLKRRLLDLAAPLPTVRPVLGSPPRAARLPNVLLQTADGRPVRLDRVLGTGFAVLGLGLDAEIWAGETDAWTRLDIQFVTVRENDTRPLASALIDPSGVLSRWARRWPAAVVVRPDRLVLGVYGPGDGDRAAGEVRHALRMP